MSGLLIWWRRVVGRSDAIAPNGQPVTYQWHGLDMDPMDLSAEDLYRQQPYLRMVISFVSRNIAQIGLNTYERVSDTDRKRVRDGAVAGLLGKRSEERRGGREGRAVGRASHGKRKMETSGEGIYTIER